MATTALASDTVRRHFGRDGPPVATKYSIILGRSPAPMAASRAAARSGLRSSEVDEMYTIDPLLAIAGGLVWRHPAVAVRHYGHDRVGFRYRAQAFRQGWPSEMPAH